ATKETATTTEMATTTDEIVADENKTVLGSGFFVSEDGLVLTNRHLVEDETMEYFVKIADGKMIPATVLLRDSFYDIAILKAEGKKFDHLQMSDSSFINVGQTVISIGSTFGETQNNVSIGFVSGFNNMAVAIGTIPGAKEEIRLIKSNTAINENNSGGPMIDLKGNAIGVNIVLVKEKSASFALPINLARKAVANAVKKQ
ncbi:MAG: trypsin-like peptidase domain-containing protein, partial [Patescibacteria group bacterium]